MPSPKMYTLYMLIQPLSYIQLPSQIFENWCFEKEALNLFAKHFETNEIIPMDLVKKIKCCDIVCLLTTTVYVCTA